MDNSLNLSEEFRTFLDTCIEHDTNLETVLARIDGSGYAPDAGPLRHNDYIDDPCDPYSRTWRDGEEHIKVYPKKRRLVKRNFQSEKDKKSESIFINALVAIRILYSYRHKRNNRKYPSLENDHAALVRVAVELALRNFTIGCGMLGTILRCAEESLTRTEIASCFIDDRPNVPKTKGLSDKEAKRVRAARRERNHREKALRDVLSIITAGKEGATQREQAELIRVKQTRTLRERIDLARETLSDERYMKEHPELGCKFTPEQLDSIRQYLSRNARHNNGVAKRKERKGAEDNEIVALFDYSRTLADNRAEINARLGLELSLRTYYRLLGRKHISATKFKNSKTHKDI